MPHKNAAVSVRSVYTMQSQICKMAARLAVTCHLYFWKNDCDLLRVTAVTRGGTDTEISQHRKLPLRRVSWKF